MGGEGRGGRAAAVVIKEGAQRRFEVLLRLCLFH